MLKAVKKATRRLEQGVTVSLLQPEKKEVRCGIRTSWFQQARGMVPLGWEGAQVGCWESQRGPLRASGRTVTGLDLDH